MKKKSLISRYADDTSGNIIILSAIMFPVLLSFISMTLTVVEVHSRQSHLQDNTDALSLMMVKLANDNSNKESRQAYGTYRKTTMREGETCKYDLDKSVEYTVTATVECQAEVETFLPNFLSLGSIPYSATSTSTVSIPIYEIAFVFDISDSMVGDEMEELRSTLSDLTDSSLFDHKDSRLSLIPFANTVRLDDRFERFVNPANGYDETGGVYTGCFDREATDPTINIKTTAGYPLVNHAIASGREVCPNEDMTAIFHKSGSDWEIQQLSNNIDLAFGTGMSDGLVWGYRSLDPELKGMLSNDSRYPLENNNNTSKHVIMMTDGRPYDRPYEGPGGGSVTQKISLDRFETVCSQLEFDEKEISFHLINFNNNKLSDEALDIYKTCVKGEGQYYEARSGELSDVIALIANQVSDLRLSN